VVPDTIRQPATTKVLSPAEVVQHHRDGFFPIRIISETGAALCECKLCALETREGALHRCDSETGGRKRIKSITCGQVRQTNVALVCRALQSSPSHFSAAVA